MKGFFKFITASTTIFSIFFAWFGITAFVNMLFGSQFDMIQIHSALSGLPNPLEWIQDGMKFFNWLLGHMQISQSVLDSIYANDIFTALIKFFAMVVNFFGWLISVILMFIYILLVMPLYSLFFIGKIVVVMLTLANVDTTYLQFLKGNWQLFDVIMGV